MAPRAKTANERKADERDRMRALGYVLRQVWVHPDDWERVRELVARLRAKRRVSTATSRA